MARLKRAPRRRGRFETLAPRILLPLLLGALALVVANLAYPMRWDWRALFDGPTRGSWHALQLDGEDVGEREYRLAVADGAVIGGHDDCNSWGWSGPREPGGGRMVVSTLVACPQGPADRAYWTLANESAALVLHEDDRPVVRRAGVTGVFERDSKEARIARGERRERMWRANPPAPPEPPAAMRLPPAPPPVPVPPPAPAPAPR